MVLWTLVKASSAAEAPAPEDGSSAKSEWVYPDSSGKLAYKTTEKGDKIMDFSSAGYMGGGVKIPSVSEKVTVSPSGGDDTSAIQDALDKVAKMDLIDGFRGAVLLAKGTYNCSQPLNLNASGVVLRGSGSGSDGTILNLTGQPHVCILMSGSDSNAVKETGTPATISDSYVPSGATSFQVDNASPFKVGDTVIIHRPVTKVWIAFMGMDKLVRNDKPQTWLAPSSTLKTERVITGISGNHITLDIPLTDSFDGQYLSPPGGSMVKCTIDGRTSQTGVENLRIISPPQTEGIDQPEYHAIKMNNVVDAWMKDVDLEDTVNSVTIDNSAKRITVENVSINHSVATKGAAKPADFTGSGAQLLFDHCSSQGDNLFYFVTGGEVTGPVVLLNCTFHGNGHVQPHARWATGLLVDECQVPESGIDFMNRGTMGTGHGWTVGWAVAWNCVAKTYLIQQPPGSINWAIGCKGKLEKEGKPGLDEEESSKDIFDSPDHPVAPASLYLAQLSERLGPQALQNIGY